MPEIILLAVCVALFAKYLMLNAPFVPTHKVDLQRIGDMVEHYDIKRLVDLGSGNGRIIGYLAKRFPERNRRIQN